MKLYLKKKFIDKLLEIKYILSKGEKFVKKCLKDESVIDHLEKVFISIIDSSIYKILSIEDLML